MKQSDHMWYSGTLMLIAANTSPDWSKPILSFIGILFFIGYFLAKYKERNQFRDSFFSQEKPK